MGNLKKALTNKNTVTVLGVILAVLIIYFGYNMRVKNAVNPVLVPYAIKTISPGTQITDDMIGIMEVPPAMLKGNVIRNKGEVVDKYSNDDSIIPEGSLFYSRSVVDKANLASGGILDYPKGYVLYNLAVDSESTYGNSVFPGNYIDIYLKAVNKIADGQAVTADADKIMLGKLLQNVKVIAVKDSEGNPVFANLDEKRQPAMIIFALPEEYYILLKKAEYLRSYDSTLIPVPTNESLKEKQGKISVSSNDLKNWINNVTVWTDNQ